MQPMLLKDLKASRKMPRFMEKSREAEDKRGSGAGGGEDRTPLFITAERISIRRGFKVFFFPLFFLSFSRTICLVSSVFPPESSGAAGGLVQNFVV